MFCSYNTNKNNNIKSAFCQDWFYKIEEERGDILVNIKERMNLVGMTQVDMILELQKRGCVVQPPMLSSILRGVYTYPKARQILQICEKIIREREDGNIQCTNQ